MLIDGSDVPSVTLKGHPAQITQEFGWSNAQTPFLNAGVMWRRDVWTRSVCRRTKVRSRRSATCSRTSPRCRSRSSSPTRSERWGVPEGSEARGADLVVRPHLLLYGGLHRLPRAARQGIAHDPHRRRRHDPVSLQARRADRGREAPTAHPGRARTFERLPRPLDRDRHARRTPRVHDGQRARRRADREGRSGARGDVSTATSPMPLRLAIWNLKDHGTSSPSSRTRPRRRRLPSRSRPGAPDRPECRGRPAATGSAFQPRSRSWSWRWRFKAAWSTGNGAGRPASPEPLGLALRGRRSTDRGERLGDAQRDLGAAEGVVRARRTHVGIRARRSSRRTGGSRRRSSTSGFSVVRSLGAYAADPSDTRSTSECVACRRTERNTVNRRRASVASLGSHSTWHRASCSRPRLSPPRDRVAP